MTPFREAFDALMDMAVNAQGVYESISAGAMPPNDSMVIALSTGDDINTDLALHGDLDLDFVLNAKHRSHKNVVDALVDVHVNLSRMKELPKGNGWQLLAIETSSFPSYIEHDGDQFLYGSGLRVLLYLD